MTDAMDILDVIDGIVDDTHPEGDGCPLCVALDELRAELEAATGLDVERLARALWSVTHGTNSAHFYRFVPLGSENYAEHLEHAQRIAREYVALEAAQYGAPMREMTDSEQAAEDATWD